jgi:hypothetical protein
MNRREHLLVILGEECSELHKETCKILRFGFNQDNWMRLQQEYNDLIALIDMLKDEGIVVYEHDDMQSLKRLKVEKYLLESKELGTLEE